MIFMHVFPTVVAGKGVQKADSFVTNGALTGVLHSRLITKLEDLVISIEIMLNIFDDDSWWYEPALSF